MSVSDKLAGALEALSIPAGAEELKRLSAFLNELVLWNKRFNLVRSDEEAIIERHIADALTPLDLIRESIAEDAHLADVGSGAGLPGIPLTIFLPRIQLVLIERSGKRAGFLRSAVVAAGIGDRSEVLHGDVRDCSREVDAVVMRAFRPLPEALPLILPLLGPGGRIFAYHGRRETIDLELENPLVKEFAWDIRPLPSLSGTEERHLLIGSHRT